MQSKICLASRYVYLGLGGSKVNYSGESQSLRCSERGLLTSKLMQFFFLYYLLSSSLVVKIILWNGSSPEPHFFPDFTVTIMAETDVI